MPPKRKTINTNERADHQPGHRQVFERNKKRILAMYDTCAICGQPIDKQLKFPHPLSPSVDHIIPLDRGGHPSDLSNLQLTHLTCNISKGRKIVGDVKNPDAESTGSQTSSNANVIYHNSEHGLPLAIDWYAYRCETDEASNSEDLWEQAEKIRATGCVLTARGVLPQK